MNNKTSEHYLDDPHPVDKKFTAIIALSDDDEEFQIHDGGTGEIYWMGRRKQLETWLSSFKFLKGKNAKNLISYVDKNGSAKLKLNKGDWKKTRKHLEPTKADLDESLNERAYVETDCTFELLGFAGNDIFIKNKDESLKINITFKGDDLKNAVKKGKGTGKVILAGVSLK